MSRAASRAAATACFTPRSISKRRSPRLSTTTRFIARAAEPEGWTSQFRESVLQVELEAHDLLGDPARFGEALTPDSHAGSQALAADLGSKGAIGIVYPSRRRPSGACVALFYPDLAVNAVQGRHLAYHWNGARVDFCRELCRPQRRIIVSRAPP